MPNGRSGGFVVETADFKRLVQAVSGDAIVGLLTAGPKPQAACAGDIARCLEECPHDRIGVEEQDNGFYIIHVSNEPTMIWVLNLFAVADIFRTPQPARAVGGRASRLEWMAGVLTWDPGDACSAASPFTSVSHGASES